MGKFDKAFANMDEPEQIDIEDVAGTPTQPKPTLSELAIQAEARRVAMKGSAKDDRTIRQSDDRTTRRPQGKRSHPDFEKVGLYLHSGRRKQAERKWEDEGNGDFSDLVDKLLTSYLGDR